MMRVIKASSEDAQELRNKGKELLKAYQAVFDILDDKDFAEDGKYAVLLNSPTIYEDIQDEIQYLNSAKM